MKFGGRPQKLDSPRAYLKSPLQEHCIHVGGVNRLPVLRTPDLTKQIG